MTTGEEQTAAEEFYQQLGQAAGPDLVAFARWVVDNSPAHGLAVAWGTSGPLLRFVPAKHAGLPFMFGQLDKGGVLGQRQSALLRRCQELRVPVEVVRDYMKTVASLIPGACVKTFPLPGGDVTERIVASDDAGPIDWPPLAPLALHREEWFAAIDRATVRIREALDARSDIGLTGKPLPKA